MTIVFANTINVPEDYSTIQGGINIATNGDTILVQPGTYNENINYNGKRIVIGSLILTTQDTSYIISTIINGNNNGSVVTFSNYENYTAVLNGFTITNGNSADGGGIHCNNNSSPSIMNISIYGNLSIKGGGIYCNNSYPTLSNVSITGNTSTSYGGGIYEESSSLTLNNVTISGNSSVRGGGIYINGYGYNFSSTLTDVEISGNTSSTQGGGIYCNYSSPTLSYVNILGNTASSSGGGIHCEGSEPTLTNVTISGNSGSSGGGIWFENYDPILTNVTISNNTAHDNSGAGNSYGGGVYCKWSDPIFTNVTIFGNTSVFNGGGVYCTYSSPIFINTTFSNNISGYGGGIYCINQSGPTLVNCILWNDSPQEIASYYNNQATPSITYSIIQGGNNYEDNIYTNPLFVDINNNNYHLSDYSPAIGSGTSNGAPNSDIDGNIRPNPAGSNPDIGAYENELGIPLAYPYVLQPMDDITIDEDADTIFLDINGVFDDPDIVNGDSLIITATSLNVELIIVGYDSNATPFLTLIENGNGETDVVVTATDFGGMSVADTIHVIINSINDAPVISVIADTSFNEDDSLMFFLSSTDIDGDDVNYSVLTDTNAIHLTIVDSLLTISANSNWNGISIITAIVSDGEYSDSTDFTLMINPVNDPPVLESIGDQNTNEDTAKDITLFATDLENDDLNFTATSSDTNVTVSMSNNTLVMTPGVNWNGTTDIMVIVTDDGLVPLTDSETFMLTVNAVDDLPIVINQIPDIIVDEDSPDTLIADLSVVFLDVDEQLEYSYVVGDESLVITTITNEIVLLQFISNVNGSTEIVFTATNPIIRASISDTITVVVNPVNDAPTASDHDLETEEDTSLEITLTGTDIDGDNLTYTIITNPIHGTLSGVEPVLTYLPNDNYTGDDSFTFTANDGLVSSDPGTVWIMINSVNDPPSISDINVQTTDEDIATPPVSFIVGDPDTEFNQLVITGSSSDTMVVSESGLQFSGTGSDRTIVITPKANQHGSTEITVYVDDNGDPPPPGDTLSIGFESDNLPPNWINIDYDADGYSWHIFQGAGISPHTGEYCILSQSWDSNAGALTPNNWLITPSLYIGDNMELRYWIAAQDPNWAQEHYSVKVSTGGNSVSDFTETLFTETLSDGDWHEVVLDLSNYSGNNVHIAWQHHDVTDMYILKLDDIQVMNSTTRAIVYQNNFEQVDEQSLISKTFLQKKASRDVVSTTFELVVNPVNDAPGIFTLLSPTNETTVLLTNENLGDTLWFDWSAAIDVDGDSLSYKFEFSNNANVLLEESTGDLSIGVEYSFFSELLDTLTNFNGSWSVMVSDGQDTVFSDNGPFAITIDGSELAFDQMDLIPEIFALHQNYPNPFNPTTTLQYDLPEDAKVNIMIYDLMGREVRTLVHQQQTAGFKSIIWDATNNLGQPVSAGMYLYRISAGDFHQVKKMVLLK